MNIDSSARSVRKSIADAADEDKQVRANVYGITGSAEQKRKTGTENVIHGSIQSGFVRGRNADL